MYGSDNNYSERRKRVTQCTDIQTAIAFALMRPGNISGKRRPGTGPAPRANVKTNLHKFLHVYTYSEIASPKSTT